MQPLLKDLRDLLHILQPLLIALRNLLHILQRVFFLFYAGSIQNPILEKNKRIEIPFFRMGIVRRLETND